MLTPSCCCSGTTVGFYFLWLEFYTASLIAPSIAGTHALAVLVDAMGGVV